MIKPQIVLISSSHINTCTRWSESNGSERSERTRGELAWRAADARGERGGRALARVARKAGAVRAAVALGR